MGQRIIVVGNGMVGHKLIELMTQHTAHGFEIVTFCEESYLAYDRVNLSGYFAGKTFADLALTTADTYAQHNVRVYMNDRVERIDPAQRTVTSQNGIEIEYDKLILATGSAPFVPPIAGKDSAGVFVYRTLDDLEAIESYARNCRIGAVMGGGLLGLEAANALKHLELETHVIELAPYLMPRQLDELAGQMLRRRIEALGIGVHTGKSTTEIASEDGRVSRIVFADGELAVDMVVFSAGIRPRDELARACGLEVGTRGGIVIDERCRTSDANIYAIGECALFDNQIFGLVAPGYEMAAVVVDQLVGASEPRTFTGADMSTKLKLLGVDVASFGDALGQTEGSRAITVIDACAEVYKKIVIDVDRKRLLGGILIGDAESYGTLLQVQRSRLVLPPHPEDLIAPMREGAEPLFGASAIPDDAKICVCENITKAAICDAIVEKSLTSVGQIKACTKAGTGCGACIPSLNTLLADELKKQGVVVKNNLCEHFAHSRQELYHIIRVERIQSFEALIEGHGTGLGCEICKPAIASILASTWNEYVLNESLAPLQDTNDYFLANIQRDGTYSVVPRVSGGEITPDKLIVLGEVAKEFDLYVKITGGQRIDLFGARVDQLPLIWRRLIDAGFESGHAYGKALRTVKSCVGTTWCRYGQQDSVSLAIALENRYKGVRAPHKIKAAVSGCTRECAEAQSKDFGLIATEKGYNLYVCGNGGRTPRHATLLAEDLTEAQVVMYLDRFIMFYIRTADRLQRTSTWFEGLEGGIAYLRQVIIEDSLGICEELEREMQHLVGTYQCEWKTTLEDSEKLKRFRHFIDSDQPDPSLIFVEQRGQKRPAYPEERDRLTLSV